jgi:hypothetical protein
MLTEFKLNLIAPHTMQGAAMGSRMRKSLFRLWTVLGGGGKSVVKACVYLGP